MRRGAELRELLRLAGPLVLVQVGFQLVGFVDTAFAGRIGRLELAAAGLGAMVYFVSAIVGIGISFGLDPIVSQAIGAGDQAAARRSLWQALYTGAGVSPVLASLAIGLGLGLEAFGVDHALAAETRRYLWARLPGLTVMLWVVSARSYLQAHHVTRPIVISVVVLNLVNVALNGLLGFGDTALAALGLPEVGLPAFGVAGIAWATVIATGAQLGVLAWAVRQHDGEHHQRLPRPDLVFIRRLLEIGLPVGLQTLAEMGVFALVQVLMARISVNATAAHQVAIMLASFTFAACLGIGAATSVQVGRAVGRGEHGDARRVGFLGLGTGAVFMTLAAGVMWLWPRELAAWATDDALVIEGAVPLIRIAAAFQLVDGVQAVASGALRGAGVTTWALVANLVAHWAIGMPAALALAFTFELGAAGLWWGLTIGLAAVATALTWKFADLARRPVKRLVADA